MWNKLVEFLKKLFKKPGSDWYPVTIQASHPGVYCILDGNNGVDIYVAETGPNGSVTIPNVHKRVGNATLTASKDDFKLFSQDFGMYPGIPTLQVNLEAIPVPPPAPHEPWNKLTLDQLKNFKGNFCGYTIPGLPFHPHNLLYTTAYGCYDMVWRAKIRASYKARGFTHFPVQLNNGKVYRDFYPDLDLTYSERIELLLELYDDGLIPVITCMHDESDSPNPDIPWDMIRCAYPKWEINQADGNETIVMAKHFIQSSKVLRIDALLFCHFSPKHGAGIGDQPMWYDPTNPFAISGTAVDGWKKITPGAADANSSWWHWFVAIGGDGILLQGDVDETREQFVDLMNDFTIRSATGASGWPMGFICIWFEVWAYKSFHWSVPESEVTEFNDYLRAATYEGKQPEGFCNG